MKSPLQGSGGTAVNVVQQQHLQLGDALLHVTLSTPIEHFFDLSQYNESLSQSQKAISLCFYNIVKQLLYDKCIRVVFH